MILKTIIEELTILLNEDVAHLASLCRMNEVSLLIAIKNNDITSSRIKRFGVLYKIAKKIEHLAPDLSIRDVIINSRILILSPEDSYEEDGTISLMAYK